MKSSAAGVRSVTAGVKRRWTGVGKRWDRGAWALGRLGVGVASRVAYLRTTLRRPLRSIQRALSNRHGLRVRVGAVADLLRRVAQQGASTVTQIRDTARRRAVVHADETGWREQGQNGYAWLLATPEGERYVAYHHRRAGAVANDLLGEEFRGVLVSDFYGGYNDTPGGHHQRCWGHLLRDARSLRDAHGDDLRFQGRETRAWAAARWRLGKRVRRVAQRATATPTQRQTQYQRLLGERQDRGCQFSSTQEHPCKALAWRLRRFGEELVTCVAQSGVPPDNNFAERAIRPLVVTRKSSGGTRSPAGSTTHTRLYSLAATWSAQGPTPLPQFRQMLQSPLPQL